MYWTHEHRGGEGKKVLICKFDKIERKKCLLETQLLQ